MKSKLAEVTAVLCGCVVVAAVVSPALAQQKFLEKIRRHYALDSKNGKCTLCHLEKKNEEPGRGNLNPYGKAIQGHADMKPLLGKDDKYAFTPKDLELFDSIVTKIEAEDADGDGATNREELDLGTYPGDAKSIPEKLKLEKYRKEKKPEPKK
jgi:hypothetical protein